jgi:hypothetical protein
LRGSNHLPQGGEPSFPLPRGLGRRFRRHRHSRRLTPSHLRGARRRLHSARRLPHRMPGGGRSRARPGAVFSAASAALGEGGEGSHLSAGARPPSLSSSSSSSSDDENFEVVGEESPCCSRRRNSSLLRSRCSCRRMLRSFLLAARSCSRRCAARAHARAQGVGGSDRAAFTAITYRGVNETSDHDNAPRIKRPEKGRNPTHPLALGEHGERPERDVVGPHGLEVDGAPRPRGRVLPREEIVSQPRLR